MSDKGLSFVVGGIPRSGTTAFYKALNVQSDVFCYGETRLFHIVYRFAGERTLPKDKLRYLRDELTSGLKFQFIKKPERFDRNRRQMESVIHSHTDHALPVFANYTESEVNGMIDELMAVVESGSYGQHLFRRVSGILADSFRRKSGKRFVGEKTPSNVFCLSILAGITRCFLTVREPFATIRSMMARSGGDRPGDGNFSPNFTVNLGRYLDYLRQIRLASDCRVIRFEDLVTTPEKIVSQALQDIGSPASEPERSATRMMIRRKSVKTAAELGFTSTQQSMAAAVLGDHARAFGYPLTFRPAPVEGERIIKLFGFNYPPNDGVFGKAASIFVIRQRHRRRLAISLWSRFPIVEEVDLVIRVDGRPTEKITVGARPTRTNVEVELDSNGHEFDGGYFGHLVEFEPSFSFRPISIAHFDIGTQEWSFMITSIELR